MDKLTSEHSEFWHLLDKPRIYVDLNAGWKLDDKYFVPLNSVGTQADLRLWGHTLMPGLELDLWTDDGDDAGNLDPLLFRGVIQFDEATQKWVAVADWNGFYHASELAVAETITMTPAHASTP